MKNFDMLVRIFVLFSFIILFSLSLTSVSSADFGDIREAIDGTDSGKTITLKNTTYNGNGSQIPITKSITIQGPSGQYATLDAKGGSRIIRTGNNTVVTFSRIIFKNGFLEGTGAGSAIRAGGQVIIENCTFLNNQGESGTAVFLSPDADNSRINNCIFKGNKGIYAGEDDWIEGGAVDVHAGYVNITNSVFENNHALDTGGAVNFALQSIGSQLINCNFTNNNASTGGAVRIVDTSILIRNCIFNNNKASNYAGAINIRDSKVRIENSKFTYNTATNNGGAIFNDISNFSANNYLNISDSIFTNNNAVNGGVIYSKNVLNIKGSNFTNNQANNGGVIYLSNSKIFLNTSKLVNNFATNGGVIYSGSSNLTVKYNYIANNTGNKDIYLSGTANGDLSYNWWGGNDNPLINHVTNTSSVVLSDYYTVKVKLVSLNGDLATFNYFLTLKNSETSLGSDYLPVFYGDYYNGTNHTRFQANTQRTINTSLNSDKLFKVSVDDFLGYLVVFVNDTYGDDFYSGNSWESSLKSLKKAANLVIDGGYVYIATSIYNGVNNTNILIDKDLNIIGVNDNEICVVFDGENKFSIFKILNADVKINNITFINGNSPNGGAIYSDNSNLTIKNSNFLNNTATNYGGAIVINGGGYFNLSNIKFSNNHATYGAGIYLKNTNNFNLYSSVFENNTGCIGQSIYLDKDNNGFNVSYSLFLDNGNNIVFSNGSNTGYFDYNWWGDNNYTNHTNLKVNSYYTAIFTNNNTFNSVVGDNCTIFYSFHLNNTINKGNINLLPDFNVSLYYNDIFLDSLNVKENKTFKFLLKHVYNNLSIFTNNRVFFLEYLVGKGKLEIKNLNILINKINYADNITLKIDLKDNFTGKLNITLKTANKTDSDALTREISFINGIGYFNYVITLLTNVLFDIQGTDNIDYNDTNNISTWGVVKYYLNISNIIIQNFNYGDELNINIDLYISSLNPNITQVFNVTVNGETREINFINNYGVWVHRVTQAGTVKFNVNLVEDDYYYSADKNTSKFFNCTFYIDSVNGDNSNIGTSLDKPFKDFKHALNLLISGGTINALKGKYTGENNTNITIKKDVNLYGLDNVIFTTKNNNVRVFTVENGLLFINDIIFSGINFNGDGGAIYTTNKGLIEIIDSKFINNTIDGNGVIYLNSTGSLINRTEFINNTAFNGGAIFIEGDNNIITSSEFMNNIANQGGAIFIKGDENTVSYTHLFNNSDYTLKQVYNTGYGSNLSFNWWGDNFNPLGAHINNTGSINSLNYYKVVFKDLGDGSYSYQLALDGTTNSDDVSNFLSFNGYYHDKLSDLQGSFIANTNLQIINVNGSLGFVMFNVDNWNNMMIFVNGTGGSDLNNGTDWDVAVKTIQKALDLVIEEGTIYIAGNITYKSPANLNQTISKNITIIGASSYSGGAIILDGEKNPDINVFTIIDSIVTLKELVFTNINGTAINSINSKLELLKCDFINSTSDIGLISLNNSYVEFNDTKFSSIDGKVINSFNSDLKFNNSLFIDIKTNNGIIYGFNTDLIFNNTEFTNIIGKSSIICVDSGNISVFNLNFVNDNISAFYVNNGDLAIENCLFENIDLNDIDVGLIHIFDGNLTVNSTVFKGIKNGLVLCLNNSNLTLTNSNFINNDLEDNNLIYSANSLLKFNRVNFIGDNINNANLIFTNNGNLYMNSCIFENIVVDGSVIFNTHSSSNFNNVTFSNITLIDGNIVNDFDGELYFNDIIFQDIANGTLTYTNNSSFNIDNSRFKKLKGNLRVVESVNSNLNVTNLIFEEINSSNNLFNVIGSNLSFKNPIFKDIVIENEYFFYTNNSNVDISNSVFNSSFNGKVIFVYSGIVNINNSVFKSFSNYNIISNNGNLSIINCNFTDIHFNGVIYNNGVLNIVDSLFKDISSNDESVIFNNGFLVVSGSVFENISSNGDGGVIYSTNTLNILSSNFTNISSFNGGVIFLLGQSNISKSIFINNRATGNGGVICTNGTSGNLNIVATIFESNNAENGGALFLTLPTTITTSTFKNNIATSNGGAVYSTNHFTIISGTISGSNATYGSGIYNTGFLNLSSFSFINNQARFSSLMVDSPSSVGEGEMFTIKSYMIGGDNLLSTIYTTNNNFVTDRGDFKVLDKLVGVFICLNFEDKDYSGKTSSDGIVMFIVAASGKNPSLNIAVYTTKSGVVEKQNKKISVSLKQLKSKLNTIKKTVKKKKKITYEYKESLIKQVNDYNNVVQSSKVSKSQKKDFNKQATAVNTVINSKKVDYNADLNNINKTISKKKVFTSLTEQKTFKNKLTNIKKAITNDKVSKLTKAKKKALKDKADKILKVVNNIKIQALAPFSKTTYEGNIRVVTKWSNLVKAGDDKTIITAKVVPKKNITVDYLINYYEIIGNDISNLSSYDSNIYLQSVYGQRNISIDDNTRVQWIVLSNDDLKNKYKWYYQNSTTYKYYKGTKKVLKYNGTKIISNKTYDNQIYTEISNGVLRQDFSMYLLPSEFCEVDNPEIITLANAIKKNSTDKSDGAVANAVLRWVQKNIAYQLYGETIYSALGTLHSKLGNCVDQAHLTIALLRALNIPAKYVAKNAIFENEPKPKGHAWVETYAEKIVLIPFNGRSSYDDFEFHADYWWCGQPTADGLSQFDLGFHNERENWCIVNPVEINGKKIFFEGYEYNSFKLEFINGKWCKVNQYININNEWVPYWKDSIYD